ncbi:MAG: sodium:solute symporter family protein [Kiritimatiellae bacterium]|nr:sodium:solute symporter family protein [Kiritimatiellia bacterium]
MLYAYFTTCATACLTLKYEPLVLLYRNLTSGFLIVAAYVIAGGLKGVMMTDALQGAVMLVGMGIMFFLTYHRLGGFIAAHKTLSEMAPMVPKALGAIGHQGWTSMPAFGWAPPGADAAESAKVSLWWIMVSTIVMGVGIGVLAQPQLIVRFMTVKSKQSLNRAIVAGGIFIFFMTGVAFIVGPLSNVYFAKHEAIECRIMDETALLDPGPEGNGALSLVAADAPPEIKARAKAFVAYKLPNEKNDAPAHYILKTPAMSITRGAGAGNDTIRPGMIAIARTVTLGTTMKGNSDTIIPRYINSAFPKWFSLLFMMTLLSAAMSTLSSQFHTMGTSIGRDIYETLRKGDQKSSVLITRCGIVVGLITAIILGKIIRGNIIAVATAIFFGICAAAFLPSFLGALFWKRMTRTAALSSILTGFLTSALWSVFVNAKTAAGLGICKALLGRPTVLTATFSPTWAFVDPVIVALPVSAIVAIAVTFLSKPLPPEHVSYCFGGKKPQ